MKELTADDFPQFKRAAKTFRALNHKLRQQILLKLQEKEQTVTEIFIHFRLEQSVASQHLAILRKEGLVVVRRDGKFLYYRINAGRLKDVLEVAAKLAA